MPRTYSKWNDAVTRDRLVVAVILIVGWTIAAGAYMSAPPPMPEDADVYDMEHSKKYLRQVEIIGGKAAAFTSELNDRVASLWEGRNRAYTIAALTVALACGYVFVRRAGRSDSADRQEGSG
jgi:hypothetical protein